LWEKTLEEKQVKPQVNKSKMNSLKKKQARQARIKKGIRKRVRGTAERPRLTVFRSNNEIYAQIINDDEGHTIASASTLKKDSAASGVNKVEEAKLIGKELAKKALEGNVTAVVFDRNGYLYHGRVKALADGAREEGLIF